MTNILVFVVVLAAILRLAFDSLQRRTTGPVEEDWLPQELRTAKLAYSEQEFVIDRPIKHVARIDRAYEKADGQLVLIEFKTRPKATTYMSDVVELSAQKLAMTEATGALVSERAFVVTIHPETNVKQAISVRLMNADQIVSRHNRIIALKSHAAAPVQTRIVRLCLQCGHRTRCPKRQDTGQ